MRDDMGVDLDDLIHTHSRCSRGRGPTGVDHDNHPILFCPLPQGPRFLRLFDLTQSDLAYCPDTCSGHLFKILFREPGFQDEASPMDLHTAWSIIGEGLGTEDGKGFPHGCVACLAGAMGFTCGDHRCNSSMEITVDEIDHLLSGSVVTQNRMGMRVNETGVENGTLAIDSLIDLSRDQESFLPFLA